MKYDILISEAITDIRPTKNTPVSPTFLVIDICRLQILSKSEYLEQ